jgi:predicted alpha-1,6-mannanase (GH76 family)
MHPDLWASRFRQQIMHLVQCYNDQHIRVEGVLHYVDGDEGTVAGIMPRLLSAIREMEVYLGEGTHRCNRYMRVIKERVQYLYDDTFIVAGKEK